MKDLQPTLLSGLQSFDIIHVENFVCIGIINIKMSSVLILSSVLLMISNHIVHFYLNKKIQHSLVVTYLLSIKCQCYPTVVLNFKSFLKMVWMDLHYSSLSVYFFLKYKLRISLISYCEIDYRILLSSTRANKWTAVYLFLNIFFEKSCL